MEILRDTGRALYIVHSDHLTPGVFLSFFSICLYNLVLGSSVFTTATEGSLVVMGTQLLLSEFFLNKIVKRLGWILFCVAMTTALRGSVCSGKESWDNLVGGLIFLTASAQLKGC